MDLCKLELPSVAELDQTGIFTLSLMTMMKLRMSLYLSQAHHVSADHDEVENVAYFFEI